MKKLVSVCFVCLLLTFAAGAANVGTIDNGYPGDTEAQAQMLYDLGLFQGTEKGFELEKTMTRAEAAVMLTRLLGAEDKALSGDWTHPFSDIPQWADKYVGWLYESGLTNGTSGTTYSPEQDVTCGQYCTFLARASTDSDEYSWLLQYGEDEEKRCDETGFIRGDAVSLSVRLLEQYYTKYEDTNGFTVAQKLINQGVFTTEQLKSAAWDVLRRRYERVGSTPYGSDRALSCVIAGVPVVRCSDERIYALYAPRLSGVYGYRNEVGKDYQLFWLDPYTLQTTELLHCASGSLTSALGRAGRTDYLVLMEADQENSTLYAVRGTAVEAVMKLPEDAKNLALFSCLQGEDGCVFQYDDSTFYCLEEDGIRKLPLAPGEKLAKVMQDGLLVTQNVSWGHTVISAWTWDGKAAGSFTVDNAYPVPEGMESENAEYIAYWCSLFAPNLKSDNGTEVWGTAGLYRVMNGVLTQVTDMPVYDCKIDPADGSYVLLTSPSEQRPYFSGSGVYTLTGTQVVRLSQDGTQQMLLSDEPDHGLTFSEISLAEYGKVQVVYTYVMGMGDMHQYEYAVENGKLRALVHTPGMGYSGYTEEECAAEQARLDALGVGVGAA